MYPRKAEEGEVAGSCERVGWVSGSAGCPGAAEVRVRPGLDVVVPPGTGSERLGRQLLCSLPQLGGGGWGFA